MPKSIKHLFIGSTAAFSGKSTTTLLIGAQLQRQGVQIAYGKPLAAVASEQSQAGTDADLSFVPDTLGIAPEHRQPTLLCMNAATLTEQLLDGQPTNWQAALEHYREVSADLLLLEGPANLEEGAIAQLSLPEMVTTLDAAVLLVVWFDRRRMLDQLISAKQRLGDALIGTVINGVSDRDQSWMQETVIPYLERQGIPVLASLPQVPFLQGVRVGELVNHLDADVLCGDDHLELVVESLKIGAMNVNAALRFFSQGLHQAVVTGGDRRDLQIAALETSTHCLILTGQIPPTADVVALAQDKEVPVLTVASDTLTTVERIDSLFGHVPLNNPDKAALAQTYLTQHFDIERLMQLLALQPSVITPRR